MRPTRILALVLAVATLSFAWGCASDGGTDAAGRRQVHGSFTSGDATHHFVATFLDTLLISVEEELRQGDLGRGRTRYEVIGGNLAYVRSEQQRRISGQAENGRFEQVVLELEFDAEGHIRRQEKTVDDEPVELLGYEAPGAQRHFAELRERADAALRAATGRL